MWRGELPLTKPAESMCSGALGRRGAQMIRARLSERGITQEALAKKVGVSPSVMSRYLNGKRGLGALRLMSICEELDLDPKAVWG